MLRIAFFVFCFFVTTSAQASLVGSISTSDRGIVTNNPLWSLVGTKVSWDISQSADGWVYNYTFQVPNTRNSKPEHIFIEVGENFQKENVLVSNTSSWSLGNLVIAQRDFYSLDFIIVREQVIQIISNFAPVWGSFALSGSQYPLDSYIRSYSPTNNLWAFNSNFRGDSNDSIHEYNPLGFILIPGDFDATTKIPEPSSVLLFLLGLGLISLVMIRNKKT